MLQNFDLGTDYSKDYMTNMNAGTMGRSISTPSVTPSAPAGETKKLVSAYLDHQKKPEGIKVKAPGDNSISRNYKSVQAASTSLKNSAKALSKEDHISAESVTAFVDSYNKQIDSFRYTNNNSILKKGDQMNRFTAANSNLLAKVGIEIGENNTLKVDSDKLSAAKQDDLKSLFNGNNSFGQSIAERAGQIEGMSRNTVNKISKLYDGAGQYKATFNPESIINNYF